jgi:hypothetical protein
MLPFLPEHLLPRFAKAKAYTLAILKEGENYSTEDRDKIIQSEHLPHLFKLEDEGIICFSMPVAEEGSYAGISIYTETDKEIVKAYIEADPAVQKKLFTYEIFSSMGFQGSILK